MKPFIDSWLSIRRSKTRLLVGIRGDIIKPQSSELRDAIRPGDKVELHVDSEGGDLSQALEIVELLDGYDSTATIRTACSAAAVIACACKHRVIHPAGRMMIHPPKAVVAGGVRELRDEISKLAKCEAPLVRIIRRATGCGPSQAARWMNGADHWFSPGEALAAGLAHEILAPEPQVASEGTATTTASPGAPAPPQGPTEGEVIALDLLRALGQVEVRNRAEFARELQSWFAGHVREAG